MSLNNIQRRELYEALISIFPTRAALARMASFDLDLNLETIVGTGGLDEAVFQLIIWAEAHGRLSQLLAAGVATNPSNQLLQTLLQQVDSSLQVDIYVRES